MKKQEPSSKPPSQELVDCWDRRLKRLDETLRASGCTVEVKEPSDTNEFTATFPRGRRPGPARGSGPAKARTGSLQPIKVSVGVEWGYEFHSVTLSAKRWSAIKDGAEDVAISKGAYEATTFQITWHFNCDERGAVVVSYGDDGAEGFIVSLDVLKLTEV